MRKSEGVFRPSLFVFYKLNENNRVGYLTYIIIYGKITGISKKGQKTNGNDKRKQNGHDEHTEAPLFRIRSDNNFYARSGSLQHR